MFLITERKQGRDWYLAGFCISEGKIEPIWAAGRDSGIRFPIRPNAEDTRTAFGLVANIEPL